MSKDDGGPAFPNNQHDTQWQNAPGMSLRDWFAGMVLQGLLASPKTNIGPDNKPLNTAVALAEAAYIMADEMLKERKK